MEIRLRQLLGRELLAGKFKRGSRVKVATTDKYNGQTGTVDSFMDRSNDKNEIILDARADLPLPFEDTEVKPLRKRRK